MGSDSERGADHGTVNSYKEFYRQLADTYFPLVAIFYHYQFRTKKSLDLSLDWLEAGLAAGQALKKRAEIRRLGQQLLDARKDMCESSPECQCKKVFWLTVGRPSPPIVQGPWRLSLARARGRPRTEKADGSEAGAQGRGKTQGIQESGRMKPKLAHVFSWRRHCPVCDNV